MRKKVTVLCGVSGSGKTHRRTTDPDLQRLPYVDIADVYKDFPEFDWSVATSVACRRVCVLLQQNDHVVLEGYYLPNTPSRAIVINSMRVAGIDAEFILLTVTAAAAQQRILDQYNRGECTWIDADTRIKMMLRVLLQQKET